MLQMDGRAALTVAGLVELLPGRRRENRIRDLLAALLCLVLVLTLAQAIPAPAHAAVTPAVEPRPECPASRPDRTAAAVTARLCGSRVLVDSLTSETTEVWANTDGTMSAEVHVGQVRVRDGHGGWTPVDLNLQRRPDGSVAPKVHPKGLVLSGPGGDGDHDLAVLGSGDEQIAVGWRGPLPAPVLDGTKATYPEVRPGVDLVVEATRSGFETFFVVKDRAAAAQVASLALPWRTGALSIRPSGRGFELRNAAGTVSGHMSEPLMWDARVNPASGEPANRVPVDVAARTVGRGQTELVLTPPAEFLSDPSTVYPIVIDPTWDIGTAGGNHDTWVENTGGTGWNSTELKVGTWNGGGEIARSFLMFDPSPFYGTQITSATLHLYETWAYSCRDAEWQLWMTGYADYTTTWNTMPPWLGYFSSSWETTGYDTCEGDGWVNIDARNYFQTVADAYYPYNIIGLLGSPEWNSDTWKRFRSSDSSYGDPYVTIGFNYRPSVSTLVTVPATSGCVTGSDRPWMTSKTPRLSATVSDPEGQSLSATFEWAVAGGATIGTATVPAASGAAALYDIPTGVFSDNTAYAWRVSATDPFGYGSGWSSWCEFTVDSVPPGVPFVSSAEYPENGRGTASSGQFTFTPATADTDVVAFTYQMDTDTSATTVAAGNPTTVSITPSMEGHRTLTVKAKDRAGNLSSPKLYVFDVGRAGIAEPRPGATLITRTKLRFDVADSTLTRATFQYRRGPGGSEYDIPLANLRTAGGSAISAYPVTLSSLGGYAIWNATDTLGTEGGVVEVRAVLWPTADGQPGYTTAWVRATVDPNGDTAAATTVGPGSVNLLTGDYTLSSTDADELGLSVSRVASSREPEDGWLLQGERLTANQQKIGTDTSGFTTAPFYYTTIARSTTLGQGGSTDSLELTPVAGGSDTFASIEGDYGALRLGMQGGKRYRLTAWIYVPAATGLTGELAGRGLRLVGFWNDGSGYHEVASAKAAWTDAWQELTVDLVVPPGANEAFFRLYNGMPAGSGKKVYFDNLSLREVVAPFGPSWRGGVADAAAGSEFTTLEFPAADLAEVKTATGGSISFAKSSGGQFFPAPGAEMLSLTAVDANTYDLSDVSGTVSRFTKPAGANAFTVAATWTTEMSSTTTYVYDTTDNRTLISRVISPAEGVTGCNVPAPTPPGRGCEVLEYVYATATTATGSAFGDIKDQVSLIKLWTWDPAAGAETAVELTRYAYDDQRRLRKVWDPRLATPLETTYEYDSAGRVTKVTPPGELPWMVDYGTIAADTTNAGRVHRVRRAALQQGSPTATDGELATRVVYQVPLVRGSGGPYDMDSTAISTWSQTDLPTDATAIFGPEDDPLVVQATGSTPGADGYKYATVHYLNASAQEVNTATPHPAGVPGASIDSMQYDQFGNTVWTLQATNRLLALGQSPNASTILADLNLSTLDTAARAQALATINRYSADGLDLLETTGPTLKLVLELDLADPDGTGALPALPHGSTVIGRSHTVNVYDEGKPDGTTYHLVTTTTGGAAVAGYPDADARVTKHGYNPDNGSASGWVLKKPTKVTVDAGSGGEAPTPYVIYDSAGRVTASWGIGSDGADARTTKTIYYTAGANSADAGCGNKPEWAGQPCVTKKAGAVTGNDPTRMTTNLPVRRVTSYTRWGDVAEVTETSPDTGASRTTTTMYDQAGRAYSVSITSTGDGANALPAVTTDYSTTTGHVIATHAGSATITREYDLLGRLYRYTDADNGTTTNEFDHYGRPAKVSDPTGWATFAYDRAAEPRGLLTSVTDSLAGTFTAQYSADGQLTTLHYPNGMTRTDGLDTNLEPNQRTYTRDSDGTVIYAETIVSNSAGQTVSHTFTGGSRTYSYDRLGRLTSVADTADGQGCTTRTYGYDTRTNRLARNTYNPSADGSCRSTGTADAQSAHTYDTADRITDAGYTYDAFGRITSLSGGLTNTYYANDLVGSQVLGSNRQDWTLDPKYRLRAFTTADNSTGTWVTTASRVNHYGDDSDEVRWIVEDPTTGAATRMVSGPDSDLVATTTAAAGSATYQVVNLHGDVVTSVDANALPSGFRHFDEFGVPATGQAADRYGWLGAKQRSAEALGGVILMGVRLYHPDTGRFLQVDPVDGGSATAYDYCNADPVNCTDLAGTWSWKSVVGVVATVASVASLIPGPIGTAAALVSAGAYAATGNWKQAAIMAGTAALAFVGAGVVGVAAVGVVKAAAKVGPGLVRFGGKVAAGVGRLGPTARVAFSAISTGLRSAGRSLKALSGREISIGRNFRIAPFGNRTGHPLGRWFHYHRRVVDDATGETLPGQGIGRHRPWEKKSSDKSFWDRFGFFR